MRTNLATAPLATTACHHHQVGASAQLLGAFCFNVSCVYGLPHMTSTHLQAAALTLTLTLTLTAPAP